MANQIQNLRQNLINLYGYTQQEVNAMSDEQVVGFIKNEEKRAVSISCKKCGNAIMKEVYYSAHAGFCTLQCPKCKHEHDMDCADYDALLQGAQQTAEETNKNTISATNIILGGVIMKIDDLKIINKYRTSEEMFDIDLPPDYQCPLIDEIIDAIRKIEDNAKIGKYDEFEDLKDKLENIDYLVYDLESKLEELRENVDRLREWGNAWKKLAKEFAENGFDPEEYGLATKKEEFV